MVVYITAVSSDFCGLITSGVGLIWTAHQALACSAEEEQQPPSCSYGSLWHVLGVSSPCSLTGYLHLSSLGAVTFILPFETQGRFPLPSGTIRDTLMCVGLGLGDMCCHSADVVAGAWSQHVCTSPSGKWPFKQGVSMRLTDQMLSWWTTVVLFTTKVSLWNISHRCLRF